jgi:HAMP domain-containing protein
VRFRAWALAAALGALGAVAVVGAPPRIEVRAELAPDPVGLDEQARLTLVIEASGFGLPRVDPGFLLENFEGAGGPSRSQSTRWVNGESTSRLELTWRLRPVALGKARVHEFRVEIDQEIRSLPDLEVTVVEQAPPGRAQAPRARPSDPFARLFDDDPFGIFPRRRRDEPAVQPKLAVRSLVEPSSAWVGQQVVWTLALDTQTDISGFRPRAMPELAGFWAREIELPERPRPEWVEVDGERYGRVVMSARALFPLRGGEIPIERITVDVLARMADADWIGRIRRDEPLELATRPLKLIVRPLPPAPSGFSGIVGRLAISAAIEPSQLDAGQAATLVVRAVTDGNPQGMVAPVPSLPPGLRGFAPSATTRERAAEGRLETELEWRYVVVADRAGELEIPPVEITYFDPATATYAVARTSALQLAVRPAAVSAPAPLAPPPLPAPPATSPTGLGAAHFTPLALGLGLLLLLAAVVFLATRRRRAASPIRRLRAELDAARAIDSPREAAKAIDEAWRRALGERYGLARGTPLAQWPTALAGAGWRDERIRELAQLFEEIHLLEFAPELADADALRHDLERRASKLARRLR